MTRQSTKKFREYELYIEDYGTIQVNVKYTYRSALQGIFFNEPFEVPHPNKDNSTINVGAFKSESPHEVVKKVKSYLEGQKVVKDPLNYNEVYVDKTLALPDSYASTFIFLNDIKNLTRKYLVAYDKETNKYHVKDTRINREILEGISLEELNSQFVKVSEMDIGDFDHRTELIHSEYMNNKLKLNEKLFEDFEKLFKSRLLGGATPTTPNPQDPDLEILLNRYAKN